MRRVIAPALLAVFMFAGNSADAGLFDRLCGRSHCDSGCAVEPACGCEIVEPACGCEIAPACGCEEAGLCGGARHKVRGLFDKLFHHHKNDCCDTYVEPACGCEAPVVDCGCAVVEPTCGLESACGCDHGCGHGKKGFFHKLFHHGHNDCGCEVAPSCGCEPTCGIGY